MKKILAVATFASLCAAQPALAADKNGFYIGADFANANYDVDQDTLDDVSGALFDALDFSVVSADSEVDDSDSSWSVFAGYRFMDYWAVEGAYVDLGTAGYKASGEVEDLDGVYDASVAGDIPARALP